MNNRSIVNFSIASICTFLSWIFGEWDLAIKILASFMILDYTTGVIVAFINDEINSNVGFKGILRKSLILIILIVGVLLDRLVGSEWTFRTAVCYFFTGNEGWSILENVGRCGLPLPESLLDKLAQLKGGNINE